MASLQECVVKSIIRHRYSTGGGFTTGVCSQVYHQAQVQYRGLEQGDCRSSWVLNYPQCDPWTPLGPLDPWTPLGPLDPWTPLGPLDPWTPLGPLDPLTPLDPWTPRPLDLWTPLGPLDPSTCVLDHWSLPSVSVPEDLPPHLTRYLSSTQYCKHCSRMVLDSAIQFLYPLTTMKVKSEP